MGTNGRAENSIPTTRLDSTRLPRGTERTWTGPFERWATGRWRVVRRRPSAGTATVPPVGGEVPS